MFRAFLSAEEVIPLLIKKARKSPYNSFGHFYHVLNAAVKFLAQDLNTYSHFICVEKLVNYTHLAAAACSLGAHPSARYIPSNLCNLRSDFFTNAILLCVTFCL